MLHRAYYDSVHRVTKAILRPVMDASSEVISESISRSVERAIREAIDPVQIAADFFMGRKK